MAYTLFQKIVNDHDFVVTWSLGAVELLPLGVGLQMDNASGRSVIYPFDSMYSSCVDIWLLSFLLL